MENLIISCIQCGADFEFTSDQKWRHEKLGFDEPKRCPYCRKHRSKMDTVDWHARERRRICRRTHSDRDRLHMEGLQQ